MNIPTGYRVRGQKPLTLFSFVWRKRGAFLDKRIPIRQILSLCDCDEHKRVERYAITCRKAESDNYLLKISGSSRFRRNPQRG